MSALRPTTWRVPLRGGIFAVLAGGTVTAIAWKMFDMLRINGLNPLKITIFSLFVVLLIPIGLSFWTSVLGFVVLWRERPQPRVEAPANEEWPRTAVVVPIYNEDPVRVFAGIKATYEDLEATGLLPFFDFYILSDTTDPEIWVREEMAFADLRKNVRDPERIFYRNRRENLERKTGNIADFCETWGGYYRYMIVFDADSVMAGSSLIDLVRMMERSPEAGIIQAPPLPVNRHTFFGRLRQFATHAYSSTFITGLNFWQGGAANYWGHNAIIRIEPFVEHCHLPKLPGREPLGGSILSHDFVEAAFMRRAGWKVYLASDLSGSYEEIPPSLISYAARDRRWCQGNLQHSRLLFTPGLHLINRLHFWMGIMGYVASPLWMLMLILSTVEGVREAMEPHPYFPQGPALYPTWKISVQTEGVILFLIVMGLLIVPKILSLFLHLRDRRERAGYGGGWKLSGSVLMEMIASTLLAPVLAFLQTHFVLGILMGRNIKWDAQDRGEPETTYGEAIRRHWASTVLGIVWSALLLSTVPKLFWWFSPVLAGFVLAIPISVWSSRVRLGEWAQRHGWFLTPEEVEPPSVLVRLNKEMELGAARRWATEHEPLSQVLEDPEVYALHLWMLGGSKAIDPLQRHYLEGLELKYQHSGGEALTPREKRDLLLDQEAVRSLASRLHEDWGIDRTGASPANNRVSSQL
ncbi:MAG TPA: glucans biosynthesis glucosyltransferase MdoH [Verrucomicrobiae bacterium]|nr:glucans biosynthesis glucosyltransferase MdoH [Verrucomicrobiae bacterium]